MKDPFESALTEAFGDSARRLLTRLLKAGCEHAVGMCDDTHCFYCSAWLPYDGHAPDCPYVEAVTLFGDPNAPGKPLGVLKA